MRLLIKKIAMVIFVTTIIMNFDKIILFAREYPVNDLILDEKTKCYKWENGNNAIYGVWVVQVTEFYDNKFDKMFTKKKWSSEKLCMVVDKSEKKGKIIFINRDKVSDIVKFEIVRDSKEDFHITIGDKTIYIRAAHTNVGPNYSLFMSFDKNKLKDLNDVSVEFPVAVFYTEPGILDDLEKKCIDESIDRNQIGSGLPSE